VWQYAGRLWYLYSVMQESSAVYSCFEIQQWMWTYAVTCRADRIRLLAGRGVNICHEVWSLSTVMQSHTLYTKQEDAAVMLQVTYRKSNIGCWPCPLDYYFLATWHLRGHQFYCKKNAGA
jgi:hypothetical protein